MSKWVKILGVSSVIALLLAVIAGVALAQGPDGAVPTGDDGDHVCNCDGDGDGHMYGQRWHRGPQDGDCEGDGHMYGRDGVRGPHSEDCDCEGDGHMYGHHDGRGPHGEGCDDGQPGSEYPHHGRGDRTPGEYMGGHGRWFDGNSRPMREHREH